MLIASAGKGGSSLYLVSPATSRRVVYIDPAMGRVTVPVGEFSRLWDLQGRSGVAVRTEVSAQTGTSDVTPLFAL